MKDLIEALTILQKYVKGNDHNPTHCEHDVLTICCVDVSDVSAEDKARLDELGFFESDEDAFQSFRFGSC